MKTKTGIIKKNTKITVIFALLTYCSVLYSQQEDILRSQRNAQGVIQFARFASSENPERIISNDTSFLRTMLQAKEGDEFRLINERTNRAGITTKRFQQYYRGIKVYNAQYLIHSRNNFIEAMNGDFQDINIPL